MPSAPALRRKLPFGQAHAHATLGPLLVVCFFNRLERSELPLHKRFETEGYGLSVLLEGSGRYVHGAGQEHALSAGSCFQFSSGCESTLLYEAPRFSECCVYINRDGLERFAPLGLIDLDPPCFPLRSLGPVVDAFLSLYHDVRQAPRGDPARILQGVFRVLAQVREQRHGQRRRDPVVDVLLARLADEPDQRVPLEQLAEELGESYSELRRRFKAQMGIPLGKYRISLRMDRARELLAAATVKDTAGRLGYPDAFGFSRQFRKYTGVTPSDYQRNLRLGSAGLGRRR